MSRNHKVLILVFIAVILGYSIYSQQKAKTLLPKASNQSGQSQLIPSSLTEDERFILNPPSSTASAEVKKKHSNTVAKLAKIGNSLEIKDCKPNILVLQVKQGSNLEIKNMDSIKRKITFDSEHIYDIDANSSRTIKIDLKYGTGDYGYVCEGLGLVGFLHIIP